MADVGCWARLVDWVELFGSKLSLSVVVVGILTSKGCSPSRRAVGLIAGELCAELAGLENGVEPEVLETEPAELFRLLLWVDIVGSWPGRPR